MKNRILFYTVAICVSVGCSAGIGSVCADEQSVSAHEEIVSQDKLRVIQEHYTRGKQFYAEGLYEKATAEFEEAVRCANELGDGAVNIRVESDGRELVETVAFNSLDDLTTAIDEAEAYCEEIEDRRARISGRRSALERSSARLERRIHANEQKERLVIVREQKKELGALEGELDALMREDEGLAIKYNQAEKYLRSLQKLTAQAYYNEGIEAALRGEPRKAIAAYKRSIKEKADEPDVHYNLAMEYIRDQRYLDAAMELEHVIMLDSVASDAYYNLGVLYNEYLDRKADAVRMFRRFVQLEPESDEADTITEWLSETVQ